LAVSLGLALAGAVGLVIGVCAVFVTDNGSGSAGILAAGVVLIVLAVLRNRLESLEFLQLKLYFRKEAAAHTERLKGLAEVAQREGAVETAADLRAEAERWVDVAGRLGSRYGDIRTALPPGPQRTRRLEEWVEEARRLAPDLRLGVEDTVRWLQEGDDQRRIMALAVMQVRPELRDVESVLAAVAHSHSGFEQYHALLVAELLVDDLNDNQQHRLTDLVQRQQVNRFGPGSDRWTVSGRILERLGGSRVPQAGLGPAAGR
jgi:hypothetical protein